MRHLGCAYTRDKPSVIPIFKDFTFLNIKIYRLSRMELIHHSQYFDDISPALLNDARKEQQKQWQKLYKNRDK